ETQQQAMFVTFFIVNVYLLMSGLFTPIDSMAPWVRAVSEINPVRHFVTISRAILMKGAGPAEIARPLSILGVSALVILTLAETQTEQCLKNVDAILKAAGSSLQHVLRCGVFLIDINEFQRMNVVYARMFGEHRPARTTIQAAALRQEGLRVEIDCIAYVP